MKTQPSIRRGLGALLLGAALSVPTLALATPQGVDPVAHARAFMPAIDRALRKDPTNPQALYAKARASAALGQQDEARFAYGILITLAPNHPQLRMEAAQFEMKDRRWNAALQHFRVLRSSPTLTPELRAMIDTRIDEVTKISNPHKISGSVSLGLRAQSNANNGPNSDLVDIWGLPFTLGADAKPQSDTTFSLTSRLGYSYRLNDFGDQLSASLLTYTARAADIRSNDRGVIELRFGPSFNLQRFGVNGGISVQALVSRSTSDGQPLFDSAGIAISAGIKLTERDTLSVGLSHRDEDHLVVSKRPRANDRDNRRNDLSISWDHLLSPSLKLTTSFTHEHRAARVAFNSSNSNALSVGLARRYASPVSWSKGAWTTSARLTAQMKRHDAPDPMFSAKRQKNEILQFDIEHSMPLQRNLMANIGLSAVRSSSNYKTSNWSDQSLSVSLSYAF